MNINKDSLKGFQWVEFKEHPKVVQGRENDLFGVSAGKGAGFSDPVDGSFNDEEYCISLMEKILSFSADQLSAFLNYMCKQMKEPIVWLNSLDFLFHKNRDHDFLKNFDSKIIRLTGFIAIKRVELNRISNLRKEKFDFVQVREALEMMDSFEEKQTFLKQRRVEYLQEPLSNKEDRFVKQIDIELDFLIQTRTFQKEEVKIKRCVFTGSTSYLAELFSTLMLLRNRKGKLLFGGTTIDFARIICTFFCKENGESFSENSIRMYLNEFIAKAEMSKS